MLSPYFRYIFCLLMLAHSTPCTLTPWFNFIEYTAYIDCLLWSCFKRYVSVGITTGFTGTSPSSICLNYLIIVAIVTSPNRLILYFAAIWLNITHMAVSKYDVACSLSVFLSFTRECLYGMDGYYFLSKLILILSISASVASLLGLEFPMGGTSLLGFMVSLTMETSVYYGVSLLVSYVSSSWASSFISSISL